MAKPGKPYHHGSLESALVDAAIRLVAERGIDGFSLAEAARQAGVSVAAPYRHFESKAALLSAVARRGFDELGSRLEAIETAGREEARDDAEVLTDLGLAYLDFATAEPALFVVMFTVRGREGQSGSGLSSLRPLGDVLERLASAGRLRVPLDTALRAAWSLVHGLATLVLGGARTIAEEDSELLRRQVLAALAGGIVTDAPPADASAP